MKPCKQRHIFLFSSSLQIDILQPIWKIVHCVSFRETPSSQFCAAAGSTMVGFSKFRPEIMVTFLPSKSVRKIKIVRFSKCFHSQRLFLSMKGKIDGVFLLPLSFKPLDPGVKVGLI